MKFFTNLIPLLFLISCAYNEEQMTRPDGSTYIAKNMWIGGDHMAQNAAGGKYASTNTGSFRDLITGATAAVGFAAYGKAAAASEASKQLATKSAAKIKIVESNNAADVAKATLDAGVAEKAIEAAAATQ